MSREPEVGHARGLRRFKPYPAYKESGVEWLGEIPAHWNPVRVKTITAEHKQGFYTEQAYIDDGVRLARITDIDDHANVSFANMPFVRITDADERGFRLEQGDFLFARSGTIGRFGLVGKLERAVFASYLIRFRFRGVHSKFLRYAFDSQVFRESLISSLHGGANHNVHAENIKKQWIAVPSPAEQHSISAFLGQQTARIDALVAKKERLIELLQEKRTALITRAVTRGLDPNVPMKDLRVEWLGEIPAHWDAGRIKWAAHMVSGHTPDKKVESYWQGGNIPWVSLADTGQLRKVDYIATTAVMTTPDGIAHSSAHVLPAGTVVFSRDATIGLCAITRAGMAVSQHFIGWVCGSRLRPEYLLFVLRSMAQELERLTMGATVQTIGMPDVKSLVAPIPPLAEQDDIVRQVLYRRAQVDALVAKVRDAVDRLKELRTALITAAVTGKIDVREDVA